MRTVRSSGSFCGSVARSREARKALFWGRAGASRPADAKGSLLVECIDSISSEMSSRAGLLLAAAAVVVVAVCSTDRESERGRGELQEGEL